MTTLGLSKPNLVVNFAIADPLLLSFIVSRIPSMGKIALNTIWKVELTASGLASVSAYLWLKKLSKLRSLKCQI